MTPEKAFETMSFMDELYQYKASENQWYRWERGMFDTKEKSRVRRVPSEVKDEHEFVGSDKDAWYLYSGFRVTKLERDKSTQTAADLFAEAVEDEVRRRRRQQELDDEAQAFVDGVSTLVRGIGKIFK